MFKKNTAVTGFAFGLVDASDGSAITSGTVNGFYTLDGGAQGSVAGSPVHEGNGQWSVDLLQAEMNGDVVGLIFTHASAIPAHFTIRTDTKITSELNDVSTADVNAQCDASIETYHLDHLLAADYDPAAKPGTSTALLNELVEDDAGVSRLTVNALEQAWQAGTRVLTANTNLNDPTAAAIADAVWNEAQADHVAAGSFGEQAALALYGGPRGPGAYLDDSASNTTSVLGVDGIPDNPNSTIASAKTTADALGTRRIYLVNDTVVTLAATMTDYEFVGVGAPSGNTIALASQDISASSFYNVLVSGVQGGTGRAHYEDCIFGVCTLHLFARRCGLTDAASTGITFSNNDDNVLDQCFSMVAGNTAPRMTCNQANLDLSVRHYSGGVEIMGGNATATMSIETDGQVIFNSAVNVNTAVTLRGNLSITDNTAGMSSLTKDAVLNKAEVLDAVVDDSTQIDASVLNTAATAVGSDGTGLTEAGGDGDHLVEAGGTGDQLTAVPWNSSWDTEVESECNDALVALDLDHLINADAPAAPTAGSYLGDLIEDDAGAWRFNTNALKQAPSGAGSNKYEVRGDVTQKESGEVRWVVWCEKNGQPEAITACTVKLVACDGDGTITDYSGATETQNTDDANFAVNGEIADPGFTVGTQDYLYATVGADGGTYYGIVPFKTPARTS